MLDQREVLFGRGEELLYKLLLTHINKLNFHLQAIYGGRIIDNFDKRLLHTYLQEYFGDFLFNKFHTLTVSKDNDSEYVIPAPIKTLQEFVGNCFYQSYYRLLIYLFT